MLDNKTMYIVNYDYLVYHIIYNDKVYNLQDIDNIQELPFSKKDIYAFLECDFITDNIFESLGNVNTIYYIDSGELYVYER